MGLVPPFKNIQGSMCDGDRLLVPAACLKAERMFYGAACPKELLIHPGIPLLLTIQSMHVPMVVCGASWENIVGLRQ